MTHADGSLDGRTSTNDAAGRITSDDEISERVHAAWRRTQDCLARRAAARLREAGFVYADTTNEYQEAVAESVQMTDVCQTAAAAFSVLCSEVAPVMHARLAGAATGFFESHPDVPRIRWLQHREDGGSIVKVTVFEPDEEEEENSHRAAEAVMRSVPAAWLWQQWSTDRGSFIGELSATGITLPRTRSG